MKWGIYTVAWWHRISTGSGSERFAFDTVVNGGNLDGQFGALAAWLAIDWLKTQYGAPLRTVEVVAMAEEEGSRFPYVFWGSKNIFGLANPDDVRNICDAKGNSFVDAMKACRIYSAERPTNSASGY